MVDARAHMHTVWKTALQFTHATIAIRSQSHLCPSARNTSRVDAQDYATMRVPASGIVGTERGGVKVNVGLYFLVYCLQGDVVWTA